MLSGDAPRRRRPGARPVPRHLERAAHDPRRRAARRHARSFAAALCAVHRRRRCAPRPREAAPASACASPPTACASSRAACARTRAAIRSPTTGRSTRSSPSSSRSRSIPRDRAHACAAADELLDFIRVSARRRRQPLDHWVPTRKELPAYEARIGDAAEEDRRRRAAARRRCPRRTTAIYRTWCPPPR